MTVVSDFWWCCYFCPQLVLQCTLNQTDRYCCWIVLLCLHCCIISLYFCLCLAVQFSLLNCSCLRKTVPVANEEVRAWSGQQRTENTLWERRLLSWSYHVPQQALYWAVPRFMRGPGWPRTDRQTGWGHSEKEDTYHVLRGWGIHERTRLTKDRLTDWWQQGV